MLLAAIGADLDRLTAAAAGARRGPGRGGRGPGVVTYSPKVFVPLTRLCRDRCHYCTFVETPGPAARDGRAPYLSPDEVLAIAGAGAALGCLEALFTLGDRPEDRWPVAREWLDEQGYDSTLAYVRAMAVRVLEETGLLPHLNPGVMSWEELNRLKPVAPSMGMMLETTSPRLFETRGLAHFGSPDKDPAVRLRVLEDAGRLSIPFTTGLLVGIGETLTERAESLFALRATLAAYGQVQEVIVQNFRAKPDTAMRHADDLGLEEYLAAIAVARVVLGPKARVQAPPNLSDLAGAAARAAGRRRRRLGRGLAADPGPRQPRAAVAVPGPAAPTITGQSGFELQRPADRAPGVRAGRRAVARPAGLPATCRAGRPTTGWPGPACGRSGLPWQEPDPSGVVSRRRGSHRPARRGRHRGAHRGPAQRLRRRLRRLGRGRATRGRHAPAALRPCCTPRAVGGAARPPSDDPGDLSDEHALTLMTADGAALDAGAPLADDLRRDTVGDEVTYVVNRNINFTNVCYIGCRFCAFAQRRTDADAYSLSLDEVADRADEALGAGRHRGLHAGRHRPRPARRPPTSTWPAR